MKTDTLNPIRMESAHSALAIASGDLVDELRGLLDSDRFHDLAQQILENEENSVRLAECAHLVAERERGGLYYQARFWHKALAIDGLKGSATGTALIAGRTSKTEAKTLAMLGRELGRISDPDLTSVLQNTSNNFLRIASRQKSKVYPYLEHIGSELNENPALTPIQVHTKWCLGNGSIKANLDIIKPSDWWAFSHPKWRKEADFDGSIPGEIYANALYYFAPRSGVAVDAMAGSGMFKRVYDDRHLWQKDSNFDLEIVLYDLHPKRKFIKRHDARYRLPKKADWIFIDPPYFGQSKHLFISALSETQNPESYLTIMNRIVSALGESLNPGGRLCILVPKWSGKSKADPNYDMPGNVCDIAREHGLEWLDCAFVSRGRQQEAGSAQKNIAAKEQRRMRSDTCVLNIFEKGK